MERITLFVRTSKKDGPIKLHFRLRDAESVQCIREYNSETGGNEYRPLHEIASNKICRATHVDLMRTVQIDLFLAGLHKRGSGAVHHYTEERIAEHFGLMCAAFGQSLYKVGNDLNVIKN